MDQYGNVISDDDSESMISELAELTKKTGMRPLAKKSERFISVGISNIKKRAPEKKNTIIGPTDSGKLEAKFNSTTTVDALVKR